jgi:hypothetical protein
MKVDLYTKSMLTIIALMLTFLTVRLYIPDANAQTWQPFIFTPSGALVVTICDANELLCAEVEKLESR